MKAPSADTPEQWLAEHGGALYRYALARTRDKYQAEEAVQETLLAALESRASFRGGSSVRTWLIGILKHKLLDQFRRGMREVPLGNPDDEEGPDETLVAGMFVPDGHWREPPADWGNPEELLGRGQFMAILQRCLEALPKHLARLFLLREVMEEDTENICKELAITPTNLWTMLYRARMGLRQCLDRNRVGQTRG